MTDPGFGETCFGWLLDLAKYTNHAEFETLADVDQEKLALGRQISQISFAHNLIVIRKRDNSERSNFLSRPAALETV